LAFDDLDDRFVNAVKLALAASRNSGDAESDRSESECPSSDDIASYYEYALSRVERARLETHFSGCARCQGTLAALRRAAPMLDNASEAGGFAAVAERRAAAESVGIRERWFEFSPAWRIAGVSMAAAATLTVVVVAGMHVYRSSLGRESEQIAAANPLSSRHHRHKPRSASSSSETQLALNENRPKNEPGNRLENKVGQRAGEQVRQKIAGGRRAQIGRRSV
jgi:hypothetical protein